MHQTCAWAFWSVCLLLGAGACATDDNDKPNGSLEGGTSSLDWFSSSCGDLGGVETPAGACFIGCRTSEDCPVETLTCVGAQVWTVGQCEIDSELRASLGCGPQGWYQRSFGCYMKCGAEGADHECPSGFRCIEDSIHDGEFVCTGYAGSGSNSCNVPCESGCCSPTGNSCCEPPFCGGICAGSPCCG
jgi:hypothetical protein